MMAQVAHMGRSAGSIFGKMMLGVVGSAAAADEIRCVMENDSEIAFAIDRNQFVAPQDAADPPRRKVTTVTHDDVSYPAEPFLIGKVRGFYADGLGGSSIMFSVAADNSAKLTNTRSGLSLTGRCEDDE